MEVVILIVSGLIIIMLLIALRVVYELAQIWVNI